LGIGTSAPDTLLHLSSATGSSSPTPTELRIATTTNAQDWSQSDPWSRLSFYNNDNTAPSQKIHASIDAVCRFASGYNSNLIFNLKNDSGVLSPVVAMLANGKVGIGTTSPAYNLDVSGSGTQTVRAITTETSGTSVGRLRAEYLGGGGGINTSVDLRAGDSYAHLLTTTNHPMLFGTGGSERMRIDPSGNVGIGTSNPASLAGDCTLAVSSSGGARIGLNATNRSYYIGGDSGSDRLEIGRRISTNTADSPDLVLDGGGNVGIGTTSPDEALEVFGNIKLSQTSTQLIFEDSNSANLSINKFTSYDGALIAEVDPSNNGSVGSTFRVSIDGFEHARIDSNGRLLVGTSSAAFIGGGIIPSIQVENTSEGTSAISVKNNQNNAGGARVVIGKSRGSAVGSSTIVQANDTLGQVVFAGADGTDSRSAAASVLAAVDGTPGANDMPGRLVLSTTADGAVSPTERLRIDSSGNVGIGATNPLAKLDVNGIIRARPVSSDPTFSQATMYTIGGVGGTLSSLLWRFVVNANDVSAGSEAMRITSGGNVGIGTSSPFTTLHAQNSGSGASVANSGTTDTTTAARIGRNNVVIDIGVLDSGTSYLQNRNVGNFATNYKFAINPNGGNVGIGTTNPVGQLDVATAGDSSIVLANETTYTDGIKRGRITKKSDNSLVIQACDSASPVETVFLRTVSAESARIDANGKFLINTSQSVPISSYSNSLLQVVQDNSSTQAAFAGVTYGSAGTSFPRILLGRANGTKASPTAAVINTITGLIQFHGYDGANFVPNAFIQSSVDGTPGTNDMPGRLVFATTADGANSPTERLRITSGGNVGIGTSNPSTELEVVATSPEIKARATGNSTSRFALDNNRAADLLGGQIYGRWNGNTVSAIRFLNGADGTNKDDGVIAFSTSNGNSNLIEKLRIAQNGNVGIGTTNPAAKLDVSRLGAAWTGAAPVAGTGLFLHNGNNASTSPSYMQLSAGSQSIAGFYLGDSSSSNKGAILYSFSDDSLRFSTASNERARIDSNGNLLVKISSARTNYRFNATSITPLFQIESTGGNTAFGITRNSNTGNAGNIYISKSRGTTSGSNTIVQNGDRLGSLSFNGADGTDLVTAVRIESEVDGTPGTNDMPGRLVVLTTADGASNPTERLRITSGGNVGIGTSSPDEKLDVFGTVKCNNVRENVFTITWSSSFVLNPLNGGTQFVVLGGNSTPTQSGWNNGESITLHIDDGASRTITWTTLGVVWTGGTAPTLATTGDTVVQLWKAGNVIYGALVGEVA